ncbi:DUF4402 domain-containing protein [Sphingorhabdus sp. M41]|uniref:DUF4402 domain-containing protein n=1 Tax=Sphingorhabdus sp. M41 TaxID=1806885 RepID=UPI00078DE7D8|nr:DUF4402 domain-containing protein [Sphingorhabdus sp. M41]AMO73129.1 hypothetical protein AZE99_15855 [Sphingorhabdus sp. M41]
MSKFLKAALASSVLVASIMGATTARADTATADARANILAQVSVDSDGSNLDFGTIVTGAEASTVAVSTTGSPTCGTGLVCSGTTTAAGFDVSGTTGETVAVSVDPTVTLTGPDGTMTAMLKASNETIVLAGEDSFTVGGILSVGANQADGAYEGSFNVAVVYQ